MKNFTKFFWLSAILLIVFANVGWGQTTIINQNIQSWTNHGSYGSYTQSITVGSGTGNVTMTQCIVANGASATGTCSIGRVQMSGTTGVIELPTISSVSTVEFHLAAGGSSRSVKLQKYNGSTWEDITSFTGIGTTGATFTYTINQASSITLRLASPSSAVYVHDIIIKDYVPSSPVISVGTITGFGNQTVNTTSSEKSYIVSGINLSADISIVPPSGFEISTGTGVGFVPTNPIVLSQSGGTVSSTTIYVRFVPTAVTAYSGNITHTSGTSNNPNVAVSGTGTAPTDPTSVSATPISTSQINIEYTPNGANNVLVAWNTTNTFGTPSGSYLVGGTITGGGTVLSTGVTSQYNHTSLTGNTTYYYKVWTYDGFNFYSSGVAVNATTYKDLPSIQASNITFSSVTTTSMTTSWTNGDGTKRVVKINTSNTFTAPGDGTDPPANPVYGGSGEQVIYNNNSNTVNVSGLSSNTEYWYRVYEYNNSGTFTKYLTSTAINNPNSTTTLTASTPTKLVITSINGGSNVLVNPSTFSITVQAQNKSNVAQNVTLATDFVLSVATGTGSLGGTITGTIAAGTNTVTISGITYSTYESGVSVTATRTSGDNLASGTSSTFTVYPQPPSNQPTGLVFSNIAMTGYTLSYTAATGSPSGYLVLRTQGASYPTGVPALGTSYSIGSTIGDGTVAYIGSDVTFTESALTSGTQYSYSIFSFNGSGSVINYLTTSPLQNQHYTMFAEPTVQASNVTFTNVSSTGFTIGWTVGDGTNRLVLVKSGSPVDATPTDGNFYSGSATFGNGTELGTGNFVVYNYTGTSINVTGLTEGTTYYVSVFEYNGSFSGSQNYLLTTPATGSQVPASAKYYSMKSGDPATLTNWTTSRDGSGTSPADFTTPATFIIQNTNTMTTTAAWAFGGTGSILQIENGGILQSDFAITVSAGTLLQIDNGGTYKHNNTTAVSSSIFKGTESFASGSNVIINNWNNNTTAVTTGVTLPYGNLEINWTANTFNWQQSLSGTVNLCAGNLTVTSVGTGTIRFSGGTAPIINIGGNFTQTAGTVNLASSTGASVAILNVGGNFAINGGTFTSTSTGSKVVFNGTGLQSFINAGTISVVNFEVGSSTILDMGTNAFTGSGSLTLSSGATIKTAHTSGLDGSIAVSGTKTLSTGANYEFNGTDAQVTGTLFPATVNKLIINNTAGVTLSGDVIITDSLKLSNGILNTKNGTTLNTIFFSNTATPFTDADETTNKRIVGKAIMNQRTVLAPYPLSFLGVSLQGTSEPIDFTIERITGVDESIVSYGSYNGIKCRWHVSTATTPEISRNVTYKWLQALDNGNDFNSLNAQIWVSPDGITWDRAGSGSLATGNPRSMQVSTTTFSYWSAADANTPLPVKLASTSTSLFNKRNIEIRWTTSSENNNSGFEIQRQNILDNNWVKTGYISGNGTTNNTKNYTFTDRGLMTGKYKYRLKQIDYNGNYEYFDINGIVEVGVPSKFDISQNYPNPFNPVTKIDYDLPLDSKVTIKIFDVTGREINTLINENLKAGYYTSTFNASSFSSGIYFYRMVTSSAKGSNVLTKKMMLIK
jgi:hypothetical protein